MNHNKLFRGRILRLNHARYFYITTCFDWFHTVNDIEEIYGAVYSYVSENSIDIIYENIYASQRVESLILDIRHRTAKGMSMELPPYAYIANKAESKILFSGIQICGIQKSSHIVKRYIKCGKSHNNIGTFIQYKNNSFLYLAGITGNTATDNVYSEAISLYEYVAEISDEIGFFPENLIRTWVYLSDIDTNYSLFNKARKLFFEKSGIDYSINSNSLPASTCVEGRNSNHRHLYMNLFFLCGKPNVKISRVYNDLQMETDGNEYLNQPTFSRGIRLDFGDYTELQISGTASIHMDGKSLYKGDPYRQIIHTMLNIDSILKKNNLGFNHISMSTCYFKDEKLIEYFESVKKDLKIKSLYTIYNITNMCRDELLFEFDGIAIAKML